MRVVDLADETRALANIAEPAPAPSAEGIADLSGLAFVVVAGPDKGRSSICEGARFGIGTARDNGLSLTDPTVSRRQCELVATSSGLLLQDLRSTNGTRLGGARIQSAYVRPGVILTIGNTTLALESAVEPGRAGVDVKKREVAHWRSPSMSQIMSLLARVSRHESTVLLQGETGTGKTLLARRIHSTSPRANGPFIVVDCGAIPPTLIETELFGHEKGAFTGALNARAGIFEAASGGTVFLDEIGELPIDMQPKLLRAIEDRTVKRVGSTVARQLDVRIVAATNRDLSVAVNDGTFRSDLLYRLNTVSITIPPLRERPEDIPVLAEHFYQECIGDPTATLSATVQEELSKRSWPGNARELRSALERLVVLGQLWSEGLTPPLVRTQSVPTATTPGDPALSFREAKESAVAQWEQEYLENLLSRTRGNLSQAAREARMDRNYLRELVRRRGVGGTGVTPLPERKTESDDDGDRDDDG